MKNSLNSANISLRSVDYQLDNSLFSGSSGVFLFEILAKEQCAELNEKAEKILSAVNHIFTLCNGKTGINWLFTYFNKKLNIIDDHLLDLVREDDHLLKKISINSLISKNYDFMHGALGVAYYLLYDDAIIDVNYQSTIIGLLEEQYKNEGTFLYNSGLDPNKHERKVSLGLSHGLPSIIRYLAECYKKGIEKERSLQLIRRLVLDLLSYQNIDKKYGTYPSIWYLEIKNEDSRSRLAWCYGDLGLGLSLYNTSKIIGDQELENFCIEILLRSLDRKSIENAMVKDAGICHGTSGIMHIYNSIAAKTGIVEFEKSAEYWREITMKFARMEENELNFDRYDNLKGKFESSYSLLEGNAGVGLALYSMETKDFSWDYCLMLND